jgi:hypothetical protein
MDYILSFFPLSIFTTNVPNKQSDNNEYSCAILIQSVYRMYKCRKEYNDIINKVRKIQMWYRKQQKRKNNELENTSNSKQINKYRKKFNKNKNKNKKQKQNKNKTKQK